MTIEDRKTTTREFLEALDKQGLLGRVNSKLLNDEFTKNFPISAESAGRTFSTIVELCDEGKGDFKVSNEEMTIFVGTFGVNLINSYLEYIKKLLKIPLDKNKISYENKTTYGQLINNICTKLGWDETKNEIIRKNFFVDFRNAISHVEYYITKDGIFFKIKNKTLCLNMEQFVSMIDEIKTVMNTIEEFIVEKTRELEKQADEMEEKVEELNRKTELIKKENEENRKKTLATNKEIERLRNETKRKERELEKIIKKTKKIERMKSRMNKNRARIVLKS